MKSLAKIYFSKSKVKRKPKIRNTSLGAEVGSKLHEKGILLEQNKSKKLNKTFRSLYSFKPLINPASRELIRHSKTPRPALHSHRKVVEVEPIPEKADVVKLDQTRLDDFLNRNYVRHLTVKAEKEKANRARQLEKDPNCSWRPVINEASQNINNEHLYERGKNRWVELEEKMRHKKL